VGLVALLQTFYWNWYCSGRDQGSSLQSFMRAFITGWLPSLLLNLWLAMVMPRLVYLIVQVWGKLFLLSKCLSVQLSWLPGILCGTPCELCKHL
jgi:hypothetical protein